MIGQSSDEVIKSAGILFLGSVVGEDKRAVIPSNSNLNFEISCPLNGTEEFHPFAVRPNTNGRGTVVSVWRISEDGVWTLMGRYSPNPFQAFYPIEDQTLVIKPNDWLAVRCTYFNDQDNDIVFGDDDSQETCNLYVMYYIDGEDSPTDSGICYSYGPPYYSWTTELNLPGDSVPDWVNTEASLLKFDNQ